MSNTLMTKKEIARCIRKSIIITNLNLMGEYMLGAIINKVKLEIEQEELEFNGRWCDDGGKAIE